MPKSPRNTERRQRRLVVDEQVMMRAGYVRRRAELTWAYIREVARHVAVSRSLICLKPSSRRIDQVLLTPLPSKNTSAAPAMPATMKAVNYQGPFKVKIEEVERPKLEHPDDIIVKVTTVRYPTRSKLCHAHILAGSHLRLRLAASTPRRQEAWHALTAGQHVRRANGRRARHHVRYGAMMLSPLNDLLTPSPSPPGHENMGIVEEIGEGVTLLKKGDRVVMPFNVADGRCRNCEEGRTAFCTGVNPGFAGGAYGVSRGDTVL